MAQKVSSIEEIAAALPAVQAAVREEIARRIAAGEQVGCVEGDKIISQTPPVRDLVTRRKEAMEHHASRVRLGRKSVA